MRYVRVVDAYRVVIDHELSGTTERVSNVSNLGVRLLGIADHIEEHQPPYPVGPIDLFRLAQCKSHIFYPATTTESEWVVVIDRALFEGAGAEPLEFEVCDSDGNQTQTMSIATSAPESCGDAGAEPSPLSGSGKLVGLIILPDAQSILFHFKLDHMVAQPGRYVLRFKSEGTFRDVGAVDYQYQPSTALTSDEVRAIESSPSSASAIVVSFGCKFCDKKVVAYTALKPRSDLEAAGHIWQHDLPDDFACECGKTSHSLTYVRESLHGLFRKGLSPRTANVGYVRMYAHQGVLDTLDTFATVLRTERAEQPIQSYLEANPILFSRFHAKRLFFKKSIIGKHETDFAVLNTSDELLLIEIEKPSIQLFKKDGHPTQALMHAYGQVNDWLQEYRDHPDAVLQSFGFSRHEIFNVRGVVIAGRNTDAIQAPLRRHLSAPPYADIEFMTFDDLISSTMEISRSLA